ncbi:MAG: cytochrome c, partial [Xanthobacteraceae bacterium]|nr:cytochrome c [Xanthobacteraceae bacterium]
IAPIARPDASVYAAATIARGRQLAALGACAVCHTTPGGVANAGGRPLETPFGTVYSTNITPDPQTGIGAWSYPAFERAMREGIHRDGSHLYPAFPYDHFALTSEADLQALYAYLMAQPAVTAPRQDNALRFPFNIRPLLAGWNALFHVAKPFAPDPLRSEQWNRGAYLVEGLGHCGACHTPRNALGAERAASYLAGAVVEGWEAPPLAALSRAPIPWTEDELFAYLRSGASRFHGAAAGPMAPVVKELAAVPDTDIRAMAVYLASLAADTAGGDHAALAAKLDEAATATALAGRSAGARIYQGACAVCHQPGGPHALGATHALALNSNLHSDGPDNLIQVILHGIDNAVAGDAGSMPAFGSSLNDEQIAELVGFLRRQFAPDKPAWSDIAATVARLRRQE